MLFTELGYFTERLCRPLLGDIDMPQTISECFRVALESLLKERGTQSRLAEHLGQERPYVNDLIRKRRSFSIDMMERISIFFGFAPEQIIASGRSLLEGEHKGELDAARVLQLVHTRDKDHQKIHEAILRRLPDLPLEDKKTIYRQVLRYAQPNKKKAEELARQAEDEMSNEMKELAG